MSHLSVLTVTRSSVMWKFNLHYDEVSFDLILIPTVFSFQFHSNRDELQLWETITTSTINSR